jgi:hypothetical protein
MEFTLARLEGGGILERRPGDVLQRLAGEEALMAGDEDVGEGEKAREDVVLDHRSGEVLEEEVGFLFINVESERTDPTALEPIDHGGGVYQPAAARVDQHHPGFMPASASASIRWWVSGVSGRCSATMSDAESRSLSGTY